MDGETPTTSVSPGPHQAPSGPAQGEARPHWLRRALVWLAFPVVLPAICLLYWTAIADVPFFTKGAPREALVVQSIVERGEIVLPRRNGDEIPSKPPLFHWAGALASGLLGRVDETTTRIPSLAASLLAIVLTALCAWSARGPTAALAAVIVLASSQQWMAASTTARVDMVLASTVTLALAAFWISYGRGGSKVPALFYLACAAAVLTKGPVGLVLPVAVVIAYVVARRDLAYLAHPNLGWALAFLALPVLWYVLAYLEGGQAFFDKLILKENVFRVLDPDAMHAGHVRPYYYYVPLLMAGFFPWSLLLPVVAIDLWKHRRGLDEAGLLFPLLWFLVTFALFSAAGSKRAVYLLPAYPALAIMVGDWWTRAFSGENAPDRLQSMATVAVAWLIVALLSLPIAMLLLHAAGIPTLQYVEPLLSRTDAENLGAVARTVESRPTVILAWSAGMAVALLVLLRSASRQRWAAVFASIAICVASVSLVVSSVFLPDLAGTQNLRGFMREVTERVGEDGSLSFYRGFDYGAVFYAKRPIPRRDTLAEVPDPDGAWLLAEGQALEELRAEASSLEGAGGTGRHDGSYAVEEVARNDYGDNPNREPLLLLRLARQSGDEQATRQRDDRARGRRPARARRR